MEYNRSISEAFLADLKVGILSPLLARIREDDTLMLALRGKYVNVYYRGGSLLRVTETLQSSYIVEFDKNYYRDHSPPTTDFPPIVRSKEDATILVNSIPNLKYVMDRFFTENNKPEREFQQLVVRENNYSQISNETEYFIVDIELADSEINARFDMLAVCWRSHEKTKKSTLVPVLIEMKYGGGALKGASGLIKHLEDAYKLRNHKERWGKLREALQIQLKQLCDLKLLRFDHPSTVPELLLHDERAPELVFLLANYNPRSEAMLKILRDFNNTLEKLDPQTDDKKLFDVRFFQASFAGYGMHHVSMLQPADFEALTRKLFEARGHGEA